ncbi:leucine-rich repeats and immunoglobulin-like domains protein 1 [Diabrotica virgifera virgifera]|uniref:Leucine-rich repeats and immunoglobulin-like domains protein 1 n=1 Tax=Diabrotica virgifera virgifera TaxID=50390 RepID=A0A6P7FRQ7_DIAVI|nr:leucine-rich repeats and immunoglobulin-like domains protein 1 [Diabrotica virgifera virgifera]
MDFCAVLLVVTLCKVSMSATPKLHILEPVQTTTQLPTYLAQMGKGLTSIPKGGPTVRSVNYGYNNIFNLSANVFSYNGFAVLDRIQLSHNQITIIHQKAFRHLNYLKVVDLSGNNLTILDVNTFKTNVNLEKLDLTTNKIRFRNRPFLKSASLTTLILSDNRIEQIFELNFTKLPKLRNLVLNSNVMFVIADHSFQHLTNLVYLSLANSGVYRLSDEMFKNGSYPKIIDVTDTPLASKFNPPLRKVKNEGVVDLINIDKYSYY